MTQYIDIKEFRERGYLHELNRQFLHPLGLAIEVGIDNEGKYFLSGIQDWREDPEGMAYADETLSPEKAAKIAAIQAARMEARIRLLGYWIQPAGEVN